MDLTGFAPELRALAAHLADRLGNGDEAARTLAQVRECAPDERLAIAFLLKLAEQTPAVMDAAMADPQRIADLAFCLGASELVGTGLAGAGANWLAIFDDARTIGAAAMIDSIAYAGRPPTDLAAAGAALGEFKRRCFLQIAIGDLTRRLTVVETTRALSRLACECLRGALEAAGRLAEPAGVVADDFCVIAMGKLGAGELNLSSDIDLIYLFGGAATPARQEAAIHIGEALTEIITAQCFRVDMRLRPGGRESPLVMPVESALNYYQSMGDTWERAALLRARPVAGAIAAGAGLLDELTRFIYRRYLDFDTLRQLRAMKRQIEQELRSPDLVARNLKLGRGGIRELEFIVQSLTLIYGGRDPRLRTAETLGALERLSEHGYLAPVRMRRLHDAYLFLRDAEHKLQVVAGLQTHTLPATPGAFAMLAARLGLGKGAAAAARLHEQLQVHREFVAMQFREMLAGGGERSEAKASAGAVAAWRAAHDRDQAAAALAELGFSRPVESANHLALLAEDPPHGSSSARRRELLERLSPELIDEIRMLADPDLALMNLASFIAAVGARTSFLALLEEHPATRRVLLRLFASSSHLSTLFIIHPEILDTLVRSDLARMRRTTAELRDELAGLVAASDDFESRLDAIRSFRQQEFLRVAIADLAGDLELEDVQVELTRLAETVLREGLQLARSEAALRHPMPPALGLCALAMGRFGAGEMSYNSDLDLIFVYHDPHEVAGASHAAAARMVQKLIAILDAPTREGIAYRLDLRLRPSGKAGPLVTSLAGFREYHRHSSAVWERQSLVRARAIAGDPWLAGEVEAARVECVFGRGLSAGEAGEIAAMRARMEREIGAETRHRLNLKQGRGGLVDVEFITQMMVLRHGHRHEALRQRGTVALIRALAEAQLLDGPSAADLESDYRFLSRLEDRLRIETDQAAWALPTAHAELTPVARRMGYEGADAALRLLAELDRRRTRVRAIFAACFAREQAS
ncbi:MAG: bifunctional [glutamate--ammonia ligase]-adenylyl-L-tyrosine phosphorylase/[glutamate--ammonia-ligase] adenylyltransferase [Candidatus Binataceae bacterium]|nr:bifunctional [glutamate--ammonia ligase]-adenylyl-L-tyrosine phosphorylase/[glutamate--ammonia-ligase] adenylyltransferase [Candidatus Binataceae bacterium]